MALDRSHPLPLWAQLESELKRRLDAGEFTNRFPTDNELVDQYGVSRHTVREAIRHLNATGILRRERGRGTVVNRAEFEQPLGALYSLFQSLESSGVESTSIVLAQRRELDPVAAAMLDLEPDAEFLHLERIRTAAGEPLAIDRSWVPLSIAEPLLGIPFEHASLYDELERHCNIRPRRRLGAHRTDPPQALRAGRPPRGAGSGSVLPRTPHHSERHADRVAHHDHPRRPVSVRLPVPGGQQTSARRLDPRMNR